MKAVSTPSGRSSCCCFFMPSRIADGQLREMVTELRSSDLVVAQSLSCLLNAGLLSVEGDGTVRFALVSADLEAFVEKLAREYRTRPNQIRRMIVSRPNTKLTSFSDAFLLRRPPQ